MRVFNAAAISIAVIIISCAAPQPGTASISDTPPADYRKQADEMVSAGWAVDTGKVLSLIRSGIDPDFRGSGGFTALSDAARVLLDAGADPNVKDRKGKTALMYAEGGNHAEIIGLLKAATGIR